jgi:hypothetical protein
MHQPSLGDLPPPDQPVFSTRGAGNDGFLASEFRKGKTLEVVPQVGQYSSFLYELNLRTFKKDSPSVSVKSSEDNGSPSGAGAIVFQKDEKNQIRVSIEEMNVALRGKLEGKELPAAIRRLPSDYKHEALHQLLVTRNHDRFDVKLDGVNVVSASFPLHGQRGGFGIFSVKTPVEFGYQALTPSYDDTFAAHDSSDSWRQTSGVWLVREGALHQVAGGSGRSVALKGDQTENYEFTASVHWQDNDSLASRAGIVAASTDSREMVVAGFDKDIWPFARFWVQHTSRGEIRESFATGLPRGFQYDAYHTIRVVKQGTGFTFFLDGREIAAKRFPIAAAQPGLYTESARAAFADASMKHLMVAQNLILNAGFETEQWDDGHASKDNPWILSGSARPNDCCARSGQRRLLLSGGDGAAHQVITGLTPGRYHLSAWVISTPETEPRLSATDFGAADVQVFAGGEQWHRVSLDFTVPEGHSSAAIQFDARLPADPGRYAAADDFYLYRQ